MTPKRILVVEDEAVTAMDLKAVLERLGYEITDTVASGAAAIAAAAEHRPDLVLMDITLEGPISGIEAAGEIRRAPLAQQLEGVAKAHTVELLDELDRVARRPAAPPPRRRGNGRGPCRG